MITNEILAGVEYDHVDKNKLDVSISKLGLTNNMPFRLEIIGGNIIEVINLDLLKNKDKPIGRIYQFNKKLKIVPLYRYYKD